MDTHYKTQQGMTKRELLTTYWLDVNYETARRCYKRLVNENPVLLKALKKEKYNIFSKRLISK